MSDNNNNIDFNGDGKTSAEEIQMFRSKQKAQRNIAAATVACIFIVTGLMFSPWIADTRIEVMNGPLGTFYFGAFSLVGAFMGFSVWMDKKK
jgi:hypothetical protein